jgi:hypothetical protein
MGKIQQYFWATIAEDGSQFSEYNTDGSTNDFKQMPDDVRQRAIYFGLTSAQNSFFFDLKTGEYHFKNHIRDVKREIKLPVSWTKFPLAITGTLRDGEKCNFYQYKEGHTNFNLAFETSGNIIDAHVIGYTVTRALNGKDHFIDVKLTLNPDIYPVKPKLEVVLRSEEFGPKIGIYTINV